MRMLLSLIYLGHTQPCAFATYRSLGTESGTLGETTAQRNGAHAVEPHALAVLYWAQTANLFKLISRQPASMRQ